MLYLLNNYTALIINDMGVSAEGIRLVMELEEVPKHKWFYVIHKILHYITKYKEDDGEKSSD